MDCLATVENNIAFLPIRYVCEAFGAGVEYNKTNNTVAVTKNFIVMSEDIAKYFENVEVYDQSTISIDVAFFPIDGKYNMDQNEASKAANAIKPKIAVPYHYNNFVSEDKAVEFTKLIDSSINTAIVTFKM